MLGCVDVRLSLIYAKKYLSQLHRWLNFQIILFKNNELAFHASSGKLLHRKIHPAGWSSIKDSCL
jgi:hypothetical protein